jgi:MFS family permease
MNAVERRAVAALSSVLGLRMFGLFLILPVLALYAGEIDGATPAMIGVALGAYGLTQAFFQVPFGLLSDRFGRKPLLVAGLLLFALGSVIAARANSIEMVILGRALQGSGAIASVVLALLADLTREEQRTKGVGLVGASIGFSFLLALMLGPILDAVIGLSGIFWSTGVLALMAVPVVAWFVPSVERLPRGTGVQPAWGQVRMILQNRQLLFMDCGILVLHMVLMALFVAVPFALLETLELPRDRHWQVYVPVLGAAVLAMVPMLILSMIHEHTFPVLRAGVAILFVSLLALLISDRNTGVLVVGLWLFFVAFTLLEALMPSLMSRLAPAQNKGAALGIYNTFQFLGVFIGGALSGWLFGLFGGSGVFIFSAVAALAWLILVVVARAPKLLESRTVDLENAEQRDFSALVAQFRGLPGVHEVILLSGENIAYLKVDPELFHNESLDNMAGMAGIEVR